MNNQSHQNRSRPNNAPGGPGQGNPPNAINNGAKPSSNQFKPPQNQRKSPGISIPYSPEEANKIQVQLNRVLGPEYVSCRPGGGGQNVSYIEGWKALNLANEIFGFNGWSSELISVQVDYLDNHGSGRVSLGLSVVVRITIRDGTFHEDFGYGNIENAKNKAMAFEKCKKEAFTDALKRCLRCFGNVLGNCLYDKGIVAKMQKVKLPALDLDWDDFHRDPLVVKREHDRLKKAAMEANGHVQEPNMDKVSSANSPGVSGPDTGLVSAGTEPETRARPAFQKPANVGSNGLQKSQKMQNYNSTSRPGSATGALVTPSMVRDLDLDDFDDSFEFSDDIPADTAPKEAQMEEPKDSESTNASTEPAPGKVFFTSSRIALDVQKEAYRSETPVFDHTFVASSVKRTVDPSVSAKVRRSDVPSPLTASEINASHSGTNTGNSGNLAANMGKRPLGMPPGSRPPSKRLHRPNVDQVEKENSVGVEGKRVGVEN